MDIENMMKMLTWEEKAALVAGCDFMYTNPVPRLGIPSLRMSDGPHGLRVQEHTGDNGTSNSEIATCFPTAAASANSWSVDAMYRMGRAIGEECHHYGIGVVLGPGVNIKRNPLGGRCFEYFSEDPFLAGAMGCAEVRGIQSEGIGVSVKHFALNSSENYRFMGDSIADMRAMREIYLKPFEMIVKGASPETLMCAYNKINGAYCGENAWLLNEVLRQEWGFTGLVMTDWGATHDRLRMLRSGLDLEMPGDTAICRKWIVDALASGELEESVLDEAVRNVLTLVARHEGAKRQSADFAAHHRLAGEIAAESAVLLKNGGMLPLCQGAEVAVVGELFEKMRYQGAGSSMINPAYLSTPKDAFDTHGVSYTYAKGYSENRTDEEPSLVEEALRVTKNAENVLVFAGLTDFVESEAVDREDMCLPKNQLALMDALVRQGKKICVVLYGGSAMELPFADGVDAILYMALPGQNGGEATHALLFGEVSPSGRLAQSWPLTYADIPFGEEFGKGIHEIYKESIFVGYRYFLTAGKRVRYPFGFGLSYTSFAYENMRVSKTEGGYLVRCTLTNTGKQDGAEVVALYVSAPEGGVFSPLRELKGFTKLYLRAGESAEAEIAVAEDDLRYFDIGENRYILRDGEYTFALCTDCETVKLAETVCISGERPASPYSPRVEEIYRKASLSLVDEEVFCEMAKVKIPEIPPRTPIRMESRFSDMQATFLGRIIYKSVLSMANRDLKRAKRMPEGVEKDNTVKGAIFMRRILDSNSPITMSMAAGKMCPYNFAEGLVHIANGKIFQGIRALLTPIRAPRLPREEK